MVEDVETLAELLCGTPLAGRAIDVWELEGSERIFQVGIEESELLATWTAARSLLDQTGRWPVVANSLPDGRRNDMDSAASESGPEALAAIREARDRSWPPFPLSDRLAFHLNRTRARYGSAPDPAEILAALRPDVSDVELDRWLLEWEERRYPNAGPEDIGPMWFFDHGSPLMFLPVGSGPEMLNYLEFWGEQAVPGSSANRLIAIFDYWRKRYDAELIAHFGTILLFVVGRPPNDLEDAWNLAVQQRLIAPHTERDYAVRQFARALIRRPTWMLHSRP